MQLYYIADSKDLITWIYASPFIIVTDSLLIGVLLMLAKSWAIEEMEIVNNEKDNAQQKTMDIMKDKLKSLNIERDNLLKEVKEKDNQIKLAEEEIQYHKPISNRTNANHAFALKFYKSVDEKKDKKFILEIVNLAKGLESIKIELAQSVPTNPYKNLLIYALSKYSDDAIGKKEEEDKIGLPLYGSETIFQANNKILKELLKDDFDRNELFCREGKNKYSLNIPKEHIFIQFWDSILNEKSDIGDYLTAAGFTHKMLTEIKEGLTNIKE